jgi:hypothetical protein
MLRALTGHMVLGLLVRRHSYRGCGLADLWATCMTAMPVANGSLVCVVSNKSSSKQFVESRNWKVAGRSTRPWVENVRLLRSGMSGRRTSHAALKYYGLLIVVALIVRVLLFVRDSSPPPVLSFLGGVCGRCLRYGVAITAL